MAFIEKTNSSRRNGTSRTLGEGPANLPPREHRLWHEAAEAARQSAWLAAQPTRFASVLLAQAAVQTYARDELILNVGEPEPGLYFLLQGAVEVSIPRVTEDVFPVHVIPRGQWFGEHAALTGKPSFARYRARVAATALRVPRSSIAAIDGQGEPFHGALMDLLAHSIRTLMEMTGDIAGRDAEGRVRSKLLTLSSMARATPQQDGVVVSISQDDLAVASCVSRPTACKILRGLEEQGLIRLGYRRITVLHRNGLLDGLQSAD